MAGKSSGKNVRLGVNGLNGKTLGTMRNLLKLKLRAALCTEFLFRHFLRYFQVCMKEKKYRVFLAHPNIYMGHSILD